MYHKAWEGFWAYNDFKTASDHYSEIEDLLESSTVAQDFEKLVNLCIAMSSATHIGSMDKDELLEERISALESKFTEIQKDSDHPYNIMYARILLAQIKLSKAKDDKNLISKSIMEINQILKDSSAYVALPTRGLIKIIKMFADRLPDLDGMDELYETITELTKEQDSNESAGLMLLDRGYQLLDANQPYKALALFERAEEMLESSSLKSAQFDVFMGGHYTYNRIGLYWAARANALLATDRAFTHFNSTSDGLGRVLLGFKNLFYAELHLETISNRGLNVFLKITFQ